MIIVNVKGGLGNQMFQYACGRSLSLKNNDSLYLARSEYQGDELRPFSLRHFNIKAEEISVAEIPFFSKLLSRFKQKITRRFDVAYHPEIMNKQGRVYLDGYFQSEKYFETYAEIIRSDFTLREPFVGETLEIADAILANASAVSLHVRRGDYLTHPDFGGIVTQTYYERAIARILEILPSATFYVFSDDIAWCKDNLQLPFNTTFVSNPELKDFEELTLMSLCRHHIIANSSFSWWGAWLGQNPQKTVIAPSKWSNLHESWYKDIIPSSWTRL